MRKLSRQDKNGVRTATDLERRYKFNQIEMTKEEIDELKKSIITDDHLSATSTNPVQNRVVTNALNNKVNKETNKGLSTNDFTDELLDKLNRLGREITAPSNGFFTLAVDADGNLWAYCTEEGTTPNFEYDAETGNLYFVTEVE